MIKKGEVDFIIGFEQLEAARWAPYLRPGGVAIVSDAIVVPVSVVGGTTPYPSWDEIKNTLEQYTDRIYLIPADKISVDVGNPRAQNMVLLGALSVFLDLESEAWTEAMRQRLPSKFVKSSVAAFLRGANETRAFA
jgi:indolepyruvate ferredoxin oxidoreductase beta subunit